MLPPNPLDRRDAWCALFLIAFLAFWIVRTFDFVAPPYEDAAILMRYSEHLAQGAGIVWNVGEQPVDGATDFLFMVTLAAVRRLGLSIEDATRWLGIGSHVLTCLVVYLGVRRLHAAPRWAALLSASYLAIGPGLAYAEAGFGTAFFGLFAATTWYLAYRAWRGDTTWRNAGLFALSSLVLGLVRPEGVFLALFMLLGLVLLRGWKHGARLVAAFVLLFAVPGAIYFFWRWSYFGHPLPNPYYIKGRGHIYPGRALNGARQVISLAGPFTALFVLAALASVAKVASARRSSEQALGGPREVAFVLFPVVAFLLLGMLHEGLMDYLMRFLYCLLPLLMLSWPALLAGLQQDFVGAGGAARRPLALAAIAAAFLLALGHAQRSFHPSVPHRWGTLDVARILADYSPEYTVAVTNAGQLPLYSGWRAIDVWGLNDHEIASHGLSEELLERYRPEVIQFDAGYTPLTEGRAETPLPWHQAVETLRTYVERHGYVLAACFGRSPFGSHYYYVRPDFAESAEIVRRIRALDYFVIGGRCFDFGVFAPGRSAG